MAVLQGGPEACFRYRFVPRARVTVRLLCFVTLKRRTSSNALVCVALWLMGPPFSASAHDFSPIKCCSRVPKM
eukprot:4585443-Prymnesium_polylepis.1